MIHYYNNIIVTGLNRGRDDEHLYNSCTLSIYLLYFMYIYIYIIKPHTYTVFTVCYSNVIRIQ